MPRRAEAFERSVWNFGEGPVPAREFGAKQRQLIAWLANRGGNA